MSWLFGALAGLFAGLCGLPALAQTGATVNPVPGSVWMYLGPTLGASWVPLPSGLAESFCGTGIRILGQFNSSFSNPACGVRAPLFIKNDPTAAQIATGYNTGLQVWTGYFPEATPAAGDAVSATFYVDNMNARTSIWAMNVVCIQNPAGTVKTGSGAPAGSGINHCAEINYSQGNPPNTPYHAFGGGPAAHGLEIVTQSPNTGYNPQVDIWLWAPNDPPTTTFTTTGNTHSSTTIDGVANVTPPISKPSSLIGQTVLGSGIPAGAKVTGVGTSSITISAPTTSSLTGTTLTFQSVAGSWPLFGLGCHRIVIACIQTGNGPGNINADDPEQSNQVAFLWDTGGSANVLRVDGFHAQSIFNFQNITNTAQTYVAMPPTIDSNFSVVNGGQHQMFVTLDTGCRVTPVDPCPGGSSPQNSGFIVNDRGVGKWMMAKSNTNGFGIVNMATSNSVMQFTATDQVIMGQLQVSPGGAVPLCIGVGNIIYKGPC